MRRLSHHLPHAGRGSPPAAASGCCRCRHGQGASDHPRPADAHQRRQLLTITGRAFKAVRSKNTVIFRSSDGRTAFVKPRRATSRKLVLTVPASVARLLKVTNSHQRPTRLKLRVLAGKFTNSPRGASRRS